jgi:hypothetical protein
MFGRRVRAGGDGWDRGRALSDFSTGTGFAPEVMMGRNSQRRRPVINLKWECRKTLRREWDLLRPTPIGGCGSVQAIAFFTVVEVRDSGQLCTTEIVFLSEQAES